MSGIFGNLNGGTVLLAADMQDEDSIAAMFNRSKSRSKVYGRIDRKRVVIAATGKKTAIVVILDANNDLVDSTFIFINTLRCTFKYVNTNQKHTKTLDRLLTFKRLYKVCSLYESGTDCACI